MAQASCRFAGASDRPFHHRPPRKPLVPRPRSPSGQFQQQQIRIHISAGVYKEKICTREHHEFILLEGDGRENTVIESADYAGDPEKHDTISSTTFTSHANNFVAKNITFKKSAGLRGRAVAAMIRGNHSALYGCGVIGLQDTLYDQNGLHCYKDCYIEGAVDFIFGDGQSIYEGCTIYTNYQPGFVTAQQRQGPTEGNGFVSKHCNVTGTQKADLGRAWGTYARVLFYETFLSDIVLPDGWNAWNSKKEDLTFVEFGCTGPGSNASHQVKSMKKLSPAELNKFTDIT